VTKLVRDKSDSLAALHEVENTIFKTDEEKAEV